MTASSGATRNWTGEATRLVDAGGIGCVAERTAKMAGLAPSTMDGYPDDYPPLVDASAGAPLAGALGLPHL
jgi:hypothetical protein